MVSALPGLVRCFAFLAPICEYVLSHFIACVLFKLAGRPIDLFKEAARHFLEDGGYEGILSVMMNWSCSGRSC